MAPSRTTNSVRRKPTAAMAFAAVWLFILLGGCDDRVLGELFVETDTEVADVVIDTQGGDTQADDTPNTGAVVDDDASTDLAADDDLLDIHSEADLDSGEADSDALAVRDDAAVALDTEDGVDAPAADLSNTEVVDAGPVDCDALQAEIDEFLAESRKCQPGVPGECAGTTNDSCSLDYSPPWAPYACWDGYKRGADLDTYYSLISEHFANCGSSPAFCTCTLDNVGAKCVDGLCELR